MTELTGTLIGFAVLFVFIVIYAFSSAAETSLTSVSRIRIRHLVEKGARSAIVLSDLLEHPSRFLAAILVLNTMVNVGASALATVLAVRLLPNTPEGYAAAIATGVMTFVILVFAEITPKSFSSQNAEKVALLVARPIRLLITVLAPVTKVTTIIANLVIRVLGGKTTRQGPFVTEEELKSLVEVGEEEGVIEEEEKEMIHSIFEFGDTVVREVMVPRIDIVAVEADEPITEVLDLVIKAGHSRIPIFDETIDNVVGIVYAKDLLVRLAKGKDKNKKPESLSQIARPAHYIPETKRVSELLRELQERRQHMAVVVDEYGGTAGIVTIEDLLEEIVGEIFDEYDLEEVLVEPVSEDVIRVDARINIETVNEMMDAKLPEEEFDTLGGLVYDLLGHIPVAGEKAGSDGLTFTVEKVLRRRISKILVSREEAAESPAPEAHGQPKH